MKIFKLGCNWGKGAPDFFDYIREKRIVISTRQEFLFKSGDYALITQGFTVRALVKVLNDPQPVTSSLYLEEGFARFSIDYSDNVIFSKVVWYDLQEGDIFQYKLQQGICEVQNADTKQTVFSLISTYENEKSMKNIVDLLRNKKQIILQGAPGTGKTYITAELALRVIGNTDVDFSDRDKVMKAYKEAEANGQIVFTTFHQSLDYEEFIEGIKPQTEEGKISYQVEPGIFKKICKDAYYHDTLKDLQEAIQKLKDECSESEEGKELKTIEGYSFKVKYRGGITFKIRTKDSKLEEGKELGANIENIESLYKGENQNIYNKSYVRGILNYLVKEYNIPPYNKVEKSTKNYVLIIDEINRGNISKIFGELITLLEPDKRLGEQNELTCTLPYSNDEKFGVPSNLYIIGTMNTTDRSLGHIDYAVRRRFGFMGLRAEAEKIQEYYNDESLRTISLTLFEKISKLVRENTSPEFLTDDIMVGHSYFMAKNRDELELKLEFEIKPLLKEYVKDGILTLSTDEIRSQIDTLSIV